MKIGKNQAKTAAACLALLTVIHVTGNARADESEAVSAERVQQLERTVELLRQEVQALKDGDEREAGTSESRLSEAEVGTLKDTAKKLEDPATRRLLDGNSWFNKFEFGGYGDVHANFNQDGGDGDQFDFHRLVMYVGYDFSDWIRLHSEFELEHAFVQDGKGGKLILEQAYVDFLLDTAFNVRIGRVLTPLGIINKWHEPTTFNGVERPAFAKYILPSTWGSDGIGAFGQPTDRLSYEVYLVNGLDGSGFDAKGGLRGGRMHERPGLNAPAVTGRVDLRATDALRLGASGYLGGVDNENKGGGDTDGHVGILSADFDLTLGDFDFRGAVAHNKISEAAGLGPDVAEEMFGWYLESAWRFWPESFKQGKLADSDAAVFVRYDDYDTQYDMPSGGNPADERYDRSDVTVGLSFKPVPNFVLKADYQFRDHEAEGDRDDMFNLGAGWEF